MYGLLFRVFLARLDPERAHHLAFAVIRALPIVGPFVKA
ncbi:MAG: dihydroorotate dehydrogenase (quinone), partial [Pseudolysinimonas sp.]